MEKDDAAKGKAILDADDLQMVWGSDDVQLVRGLNRPQGGDPLDPGSGAPYTDPSIFYGSVLGVPYCASYNAELYKQLSPAMISALRARFPTTA